jgi:hypothetical protein
VLSQLPLPVLRERFPNRGLVAGEPPEPCAVFPGIHAGIRRVAIYDDGDELTVCVDDLTHGHFAEYGEELSESERAGRIVEAVAEFLDDLFADRVVVWGQHNTGGGWYTRDLSGAAGVQGVPEFVWSGPRT